MIPIEVYLCVGSEKLSACFSLRIRFPTVPRVGEEFDVEGVWTSVVSASWSILNGELSADVCLKERDFEQDEHVLAVARRCVSTGWDVEELVGFEL